MARLSRMSLVVAAVLICAAGAFAQEQRAAQAGPAQFASEKEFEAATVSIDFPGGSVAEYYRLIQRQQPACPIVMGRDVERIAMPPTKFSRARLIDAVQIPGRVVAGVGVSPVGGTGEAGAGGFVPPTFAVAVDRGDVSDWISAAPDRINVDVAACTVSEYLASLRKVAPSLNVVIGSAETGAVQVPAVSLKGVSIGEAIGLLGSLPADGGGHRLNVERVGDVFIIDAFTTKPPSGNSRTWVSSLQNLTQLGMSTEDVLSAVDAAMSVVEQPAQIKYHRETGILIVKGNDEAVNAVSSVMNQLFEQAVKTREKK